MTDWDGQDPDVLASWAARPMCYEAPHPPGATPRKYQEAAVEYALARPHAIIGDPPGIGKTAECIMLSNAIGAKRNLVVCPASLILNWEREIWRWSTIPNVSTYPILAGRDGVSPTAHYVITSYDMLRNADILWAMLDMRWDHLILDEAHYLKDPKGNKRTQAIGAENGLQSVVGRITMATGTLLPNQPVELYNSARLLAWDAIDRMSLEAFREHYYAKGSGFVTGRYLARDKSGATAWKYGPHWSNNVRNVPRRLDELGWRLRKHLMVRRLKKDVMPELPERQWHLIPLSTTPGMKAAMKHPGWAEAAHLFEMNPGQFVSSIPIDGAISTARRLLGEEKVEATAAYVEQLLMEGAEAVIVGAWHHSVLDGLRALLEKHGLTYMDGATSTKQKQAEVDRFQTDPSVRVMLGQMLPLGEGWTLTRAQDVVLPEPWWVPGKNDQLLDRVHRHGQTGDMVIGHMLVVPNTMDEKVLADVIEKDKNIHATMDAR